MARRKSSSKPSCRFDFRYFEERMYHAELFDGITRQDIADCLSITLSAFRYKLTGRIPFTVFEIVKIRDLLHLTPEEVGRLFFTVSV